MKKKLKCFVCHKEINEEEDYVFKGQTVHKGVCLKSMIDEYNAIRNLQIRNKRLCSEIDRLNKEYERIYNENCKLRENHNINDIILLDENERLNNIIKELSKDVDMWNKKYNEQFNIINKLEEIINYEIQEWKDTDDELMKARVQEDKHILEVIEELKENNNV